MTNSNGGMHTAEIEVVGAKPSLNISKLGIVSRDYWKEYENGYRDYSQVLPAILKLLDDKGCDSVLFSLYGVIVPPNYNAELCFGTLQNIKVVFMEEFSEDKNDKGYLTRIAKRFVVHHRKSDECEWSQYEIRQCFGSLTERPPMDKFVKDEMPRRILGNGCVLLCGETNGVKYSRESKCVKDVFGVRKAIPENVRVILNPVHDRMTRFEMTLKRKFLSEQNRWVVSVWNRGRGLKLKLDDQSLEGQTRDGQHPAWTVYHNGEEKEIEPLDPGLLKDLKVEIGIVCFPL